MTGCCAVAGQTAGSIHVGPDFFGSTFCFKTKGGKSIEYNRAIKHL
jgi:hypothetical protein